MTRQVREERHGLLTVVSGRIDGTVSTTVVGYQPGAENAKACLREMVATALDEPGVTAVIV